MLQSLAIPCEVLHHDGGFLLVVPAEIAEKARYEIWQYEQENRASRPPPPGIRPVYQSGLYGAVGYVLVISLVAVLSGESAFQRDWLAVVWSSSIANFLNTLLLDSSHRAIGASTAVFAALGLLAGFVWRGRLMRQDRWAYRVGPLVGGVALLAFTGTGDANTDVGAHLAGFVCGLITGMLLTIIYPLVTGEAVQRWSGAAALSAVLLAWAFAL